MSVQRFLWEADQLAYEPYDSAPTEHGARLLAPPGEYVSFEDYDQLQSRCEELEEALKLEEADRLEAKRAAVDKGELCADLRDALALINQSTNDPRILAIARTALQKGGEDG